MRDSRRWRVVIVDDEAPARRRLQNYLAADDRIEVVGEAGDGIEAIEVIESLKPDILLLDVQMPELDGFGVLEHLEVDPLPYVVFVTAHDAHAVQAFEVRALDYLLKPVSPERLQEALDRVPGVDASAQRLEGLGEDRRDEQFDRFLVRSRGRMLFVRAEDVDWIGAKGNYSALHVGKATYLVRITLQVLEERLPPSRFVRIHRSTIVNLDRVAEMQPWSHGDLVVRLTDGTELRLSRRYKDRLVSS